MVAVGGEPLLGADVPGLLCVEVEVRPALPGLHGELLGGFDPVDEPLARGAQGKFRVDIDDACKVDDGEEEVSKLRKNLRVGLCFRRGPTGAGELGLDFGDLLSNLGKRSVDVRPVESDGRCPALHLAGVE